MYWGKVQVRAFDRHKLDWESRQGCWFCAGHPGDIYVTELRALSPAQYRTKSHARLGEWDCKGIWVRDQLGAGGEHTRQCPSPVPSWAAVLKTRPGAKSLQQELGSGVTTTKHRSTLSAAPCKHPTAAR